MVHFSHRFLFRSNCFFLCRLCWCPNLPAGWLAVSGGLLCDSLSGGDLLWQQAEWFISDEGARWPDLTCLSDWNQRDLNMCNYRTI